MKRRIKALTNNGWIHHRSPELVGWSSEHDHIHKRTLLCLTRGSKISCYFSQKRFASEIPLRWNGTIRHTLTEPEDTVRKVSKKEIATAEVHSDIIKTTDTPAPMLTLHHIINFQKGTLFLSHSRLWEWIQGKARKYQKREGTSSEDLDLCLSGNLWVRVHVKVGFCPTHESHGQRPWEFENLYFDR